MKAGYVIARENFKEAEKHVSADADPVMFNLLFGLQSLTNQIEADFAFLRAGIPSLQASPAKPKSKRGGAGKRTPKKKLKKKTRRS
ncbi:hypothetical protein JQ615_28685 [Bradyrhizobium jicamae]|uniref:Transposase n=1 Tax=Bradyrhizobium jicamae TaxID=280332 RepID=A0ABS5FRC8_9BRAD|nr:hypothetical protein [Bradyrhizobium jicamae]MBR0799370.1 hypothetical protein [Bradyrhizobium jicamae]MBR0936598.1 hypothetical protein [Bradyrhizobium jicamae]